MADVFVSYDHRDRTITQQIVGALEESGRSVWWDDRIRPSETFDRTIEAELSSAGAVLALWSRNSVQSEWVQAEANFARCCSPNKLVQLRLEACASPFDEVENPNEDYFEDLRSAAWQKALLRIAECIRSYPLHRSMAGYDRLLLDRGATGIVNEIVETSILDPVHAIAGARGCRVGRVAYTQFGDFLDIVCAPLIGVGDKVAFDVLQYQLKDVDYDTLSIFDKSSVMVLGENVRKIR